MKPTGHLRFDILQLAVLAAASPLFIFPKPRFWWVLLVIPMLWLIRGVVQKRCIEPTPADVPLLIFVTAVLVSTAHVPDVNHSLAKIAGVIFAIGIYYALTALLKSEQLIRWGLAFFMAGCTAFAVIGLLGMPTFKVKHLHLLMKIKDKLPRFDFNLPGAELGFAPTVVGGMLLLAIPLFTVAAAVTRGWKRLIPISGLLVTGAVLLLTQARGAWLGLFAGTVILGIMGLRYFLLKQKNAMGLAVTFIIIGILVGMLTIYAVSQSPQLRPGIKQAEGTMMFRVQLWDLTMPVIRDNPWWGIGLNNFRMITEVRYFWSHAHNQFLHVAVELGIPALAAYLALLLAMGYMCVRVWTEGNARPQWMRFAVLGLGWGQLAHLVFCLTDAIPPGAKVGILFWFSLALITSIYLWKNERNRHH